VFGGLGESGTQLINVLANSSTLASDETTLSGGSAWLWRWFGRWQMRLGHTWHLALSGLGGEISGLEPPVRIELSWTVLVRGRNPAWAALIHHTTSHEMSVTVLKPCSRMCSWHESSRWVEPSARDVQLTRFPPPSSLLPGQRWQLCVIVCAGQRWRGQRNAARDSSEWLRQLVGGPRGAIIMARARVFRRPARSCRAPACPV